MARGKSYFPYTMYGKSEVASLTGVGSFTSDIELFGKFNFVLSGTGSVQLIEIKKSFDGSEFFQIGSYTTNGVFELEEVEDGVTYKAEVVSLAAGVSVVRLSQ